jgi:arylsulfatase A-like enzyme
MRGTLLVSALALVTAMAAAAPAMARDAAPQPAPAAPSPAQMQESRPNVLIWMMDDVGFAQVSSYGGLVETPNIDRVAAMGLRFVNHRTPPICSASRAAILTGRNPHSVGIGNHAAASLDAPGYNGVIPADAGSIAANMKAAGYATYALGKWDHMPTREMTPAGPFDRWPVGQGFERFYGFLAAETDQFEPGLVRDTSQVVLPQDPAYHLSADMADQAIDMIGARATDAARRPFLMYWASGIAHGPHHAPADWIARYKGRFDGGWDKARERILKNQIARGMMPKGTKMAPRADGMPAWNSLSADDKRLYARQMEVFAASLTYTDAQFGRMLDALEKSGELDNTIVIITSDNGASAEGAHHGTHNEHLFMNGHYASVAENLPFIDQWGGPKTWPHYSMGWAVAGNTPFRYYKQTTYDGGTRVPLVMAWPKGIAARGEMRGQFTYVTDIAPTVMELAGVPLAETLNNVKQRPMQGMSFGYTIGDAKAADRKPAQYYEMFGNKGIWAGGWTAVTSHRTDTWDLTVKRDFSAPWELYDVRKDPGQTTNLAAKHPEKVAELDRLFTEQAERNNVLPLRNASDARPYQARLMREIMAMRQGRWVYDVPVSNVAEGAGPPLLFMPFKMTSTVDLAQGGESGPVWSVGGAHGGMAFYLRGGVPVFTMRALDGTIVSVEAPAGLVRGANAIELVVARDPIKVPLAPMDVAVTIRANGQTLVSQKVNYAMPVSYGISQTFDIGIDLGSAVDTGYAANTPFPGRIGRTVFDFSGR